MKQNDYFWGPFAKAFVFITIVVAVSSLCISITLLLMLGGV